MGPLHLVATPAASTDISVETLRILSQKNGDQDAEKTLRLVNRNLRMADQQDQGAVAPAIAIGQVTPPPIPTEQHDDGAVMEVARAEAELQQEVAKMLAAQPLVITPAKKSKQFTSKFCRSAANPVSERRSRRSKNTSTRQQKSANGRSARSRRSGARNSIRPGSSSTYFD